MLKKPAFTKVKSGGLLADVRESILAARENIARTVNPGLVFKYWQADHWIRTDILRGKRAEHGAKIVATLSRQLGGSRRISPCESKKKLLRPPANIGRLDHAKKPLGVGQLLSIMAVQGALMRSDPIAMPSKMSGSENSGGISRRRVRMIFPARTLRPASGTRPISESTLA